MWLSSTVDSRSLRTGCHRAPPLEGFGDITSSSMPEEGSRRLGAIKPSSTAPNDGGKSSSAALVGFSSSMSSSTAHKLLFLLCAVKHGRRMRLTTRHRRACFVVAYCAMDFAPRPGRLTARISRPADGGRLHPQLRHGSCAAVLLR